MVHEDSDSVSGDGAGLVADDVVAEAISDEPAPVEARRRLSGWLSPTELSPLKSALIFGMTTVLALTALCGWLGYRAHQQRQADQFRAQLLEAGKRGAVDLTTIDYEHAEADVQRILDSATGKFYDDFKNRSGPFIDAAKKMQSKSVGTVTEASLESSNDQGGRVLAAVRVNSTIKGTPEDKPRYWRMRVTVDRQQDGVKVSKIEFVP